MTRLKLRVYRRPGHSEIFFRITFKNNDTVRMTAVIDTGAQISLLPESLLEEVNVRNPRKVWVERAGIPEQGFEAIQGTIMLIVEDEQGPI
jgi:hypothetical protein